MPYVPPVAEGGCRGRAARVSRGVGGTDGDDIAGRHVAKGRRREMAPQSFGGGSSPLCRRSPAMFQQAAKEGGELPGL